MQTLLRVPLVILACISGCVEPRSQPHLNSKQSAVVYGRDDRLDVYEEPSPIWSQRARSAVAALIEKQDLSIGSEDVTVTDRALGARFALCDGQRFAAQPSLAECSATLIDEDLVLTAGHCFASASETQCQRYHYVFDYIAASESKMAPIAASNVYACKRILTWSATTVSPPGNVDYAVVQLDRPVSQEQRPLPISTRTPSVGEPLTVMGFPSGLPLKIDHGGRLREVETLPPELFALDSDTFAASSGSGVFDAQGGLVGSIVSGSADYLYLADAGCQVVREIDAGMASAPFEQALHATYVIDALCRAGWPNLTLCGRAPRCGDGFCSAEERKPCVGSCSSARCEADCGVPQIAPTIPSVHAALPAPEAGPEAGTAQAAGCSTPTGRGRIGPLDSLAALVILGAMIRRRRSAHPSDHKAALR